MSTKLAGTSAPRSNLYRFIRLVLGESVTDCSIAHQWDMDIKNFSDFKFGKYPVPRVERLVQLADILKVDNHLVFEVAKGVPAQRIYHLINELNLKKGARLSAREIIRARKMLQESEQRYKKLFHSASDAIFITDIQNRLIIDCNKKAEHLLGRNRREIIGMHHTRLHPSGKSKYYQNRFQRRLIHGKNLDVVPAQVVRSDHQIVPVLVTTNVIELDGRLVLYGIFRDISRIKSITFKS